MATTKKLLVQFGDGANPQAFSHACTINTSQDFTVEATTTDARQKRNDVTRRVREAAENLTRGCLRNSGLFKRI
ncbi:hypothetical protein [Rhizobium sp. SGZ-381]|uniref:hypothetical protein n=1 Tax=Rhizobium sp. SGZ-381 TaxID=3342800 RepID=UPI003670BF1F